MKDKNRARLLAYLTGFVNQELLRHEYLAAEIRMLRAHLPLRLTDRIAESATAFREALKKCSENSHLLKDTMKRCASPLRKCAVSQMQTTT